MEILGQTSLLVAVTSFALGISALARNHRNKLFIAFTLLCTVISIWSLSFFLNGLFPEAGFYRGHLLMNAWLAPSGLAFIRVMARARDGLSRRLFDLSLALAIGLTGALIFRLDEHPMVRGLLLFSPGVIVAQIIALLRIDRRLVSGSGGVPPKRPSVGFGPARRVLIYLGALLVLATSVMDHVPFLGSGIPALGNIAFTIYLFFLSQAIAHQRLLNIGAIFSRFLVILTISLTLTGVYSILFAWIQDRPGLFFINSFFVSFLILVLLDPLRSFVRYLTQRLFSKEHRMLLATLREAQRKLTARIDQDSLFDSILLVTEQVLRPHRVALFVLGPEGTKYRKVGGSELRMEGHAEDARGEPGAPLRELLADHPLLKYCIEIRRRGELPVVLDQVIENELDRSASRAQRERLLALIQGLKALDSNLLIPLLAPSERPDSALDTGSILGFVTMYAPSPPEPWANNWGILHIVFPYYEQAAQTLRNMEVFVRAREKERLAALGEMAAGLAHEIRNPLGAIKGAAQFLDPSDDRPESRFLRIIIEETDRLNRVVTQFLDYSKPSSREFERFDVRTLVEKTVEACRPGMNPEIELGFEPGGVPAWVNGAPMQLQQMLVNLIQNAARAVEGREKPSVKIRVRLEKGDSVVIEIEDNGQGIRKEHLDKLFIPFFTTATEGTGLGLSICQKFIENHGGRITVSTQINEGSVFSVWLPYLKPVEAPAEKGVSGMAALSRRLLRKGGVHG